MRCKPLKEICATKIPGKQALTRPHCCWEWGIRASSAGFTAVILAASLAVKAQRRDREAQELVSTLRQGLEAVWGTADSSQIGENRAVRERGKLRIQQLLISQWTETNQTNLVHRVDSLSVKVTKWAETVQTEWCWFSGSKRLTQPKLIKILQKQQEGKQRPEGCLQLCIHLGMSSIRRPAKSPLTSKNC